MSEECYCDYEPWDFYQSTDRKARKSHRCDECRRTITAGENYEYTFAIFQGDPTNARTCSHCKSLREYVTANVPCFCWQHENMLEDAIETLREYAHESPGLFFGGARFFIKARQIRAQQWRDRNL